MSSRFTMSSKASAALLLTLLAVPTTTSALSLHSRSSSTSPEVLFSRDDSSCGDSSYVQCSTAGLPSDFCCPADQSCIALAGNTTALCCPTGSDCSEIEPIPCDISLEDKSQHPDNVVMTSALTGTLETCGSKCCPFGFSCNADGNCAMKSDQSQKPSTSSVASTASATSTATSTSGTSASTTDPSTVIPATTGSADSSTATSTGESSGATGATATASAGADTTSSSSSSSSTATSSDTGASSSNAGAIAGGIIGGIAGAVFLGMLIWFCIKKEMKRKEASKNQDPSNNEKGYPNGPRDSRSSSFGNILNNPVTRGNSGRSVPTRGAISKPILSEEQAAAMMRSDFGRKVSPHEGDFPEGPDDYEGYYGRGLNIEKDEEDGYRHSRQQRPESGMSSSTCSLDADLEHDIHEVLRSPPKIETPRRPVDSMYAAYDYLNDPGRESHYPDPSSPSHNNLRDTNIPSLPLPYQAPLKMPNARHFGGNDARVSVAGVAEGRPLSDYGGQRVTKDPNAAYIDVFADSNALAPPAPLGRGQAGDRLTDFGDFIPEESGSNNGGRIDTFGANARK